LGAPRYLAYLLEYNIHRRLSPDTHDPVFTLMFYREMLPLIVQAVLVAVPCLWGMRQGTDVRRFTPLLRIVLWTAAIGTLTVLAIQEPGFVFFLKGYWLQRIWQGGQIRLLRLIVYWPVGYLVASAIWRRWYGRTALV
jgi:hypothetical protein